MYLCLLREPEGQTNNLHAAGGESKVGTITAEIPYRGKFSRSTVFKVFVDSSRTAKNEAHEMFSHALYFLIPVYIEDSFLSLFQSD